MGNVKAFEITDTAFLSPTDPKSQESDTGSGHFSLPADNSGVELSGFQIDNFWRARVSCVTDVTPEVSCNRLSFTKQTGGRNKALCLPLRWMRVSLWAACGMEATHPFVENQTRTLLGNNRRALGILFSQRV